MAKEKPQCSSRKYVSAGRRGRPVGCERKKHRRGLHCAISNVGGLLPEGPGVHITWSSAREMRENAPQVHTASCGALN